MTRPTRDERGSNVVEFSLVFPVFILFIVAALALLWLGYVKVSADQASKEGARYATVSLNCLPPGYAPGTYNCTAGQPTYPDSTLVANRINSRVPLFNLQAADVTVTYSWVANGANQSCSPNPPIAQQPCQPPKNATATVRVTKTLPAPLRPLAGIFNLGSTISSTAHGDTRGE